MLIASRCDAEGWLESMQGTDELWVWMNSSFCYKINQTEDVSGSVCEGREEVPGTGIKATWNRRNRRCTPSVYADIDEEFRGGLAAILREIGGERERKGRGFYRGGVAWRRG
jgi:hypothetical protein